MNGMAKERHRGGKRTLVVLLVCVTAVWAAAPAYAHQVWVETASGARAGQPHEVEVCWGHSGSREGGSALAKQQDKLTVCVAGPSGRQPLAVTTGSDSFTTQFTPQAAGCHAIGAELQVGIIDRELHGIPANTRIVMCGKACARVDGKPVEPAAPLGFDLELVPVSDLHDVKPGDAVTVKVLHRGKPIGGRNVLVSLNTAGSLPRSETSGIVIREWSIESTADPSSGEVAFPLIVGGQHLFLVKFIDETAGTYEGERNDRSDFSHLCKGDKFERTMYVSTLTFQVPPR
jgi:uncharacterized GH25 family protein